MVAFPAAPSSTERPVCVPDKTDALEHVVRQGLYEKSRSNFEKRRQENGVPLQQHVHRKVFFYVWTEKGGAGHDSFDLNNQCSRAHLRVAPVQWEESGGTQFVSKVF
ncbi:hypothetical protein NPIL_584401 [Nephila pilipes]|uniref:Uncharacterized protein n=1 Tax=Nephila pilipes TaxID=299642 RepID=A0A8X6T2B3_NEPPI|nr:hypothetical protein NPIL_584401 [Nephila pilipes]